MAGTSDNIGDVRDLLGELLHAGPESVLLLELAAEQGLIAPRVLVALPGSGPDDAVELSAFASLAVSPGWHEGGTLGAWSRSDANVSGAYFAASLAVAPPIAPIDTLLVIAAPRDRSVEPLVSSMRARLEAALGARRRQLLGALLLTAVEQAADAIEVTDRAARVVYVNRAWQRVFGYPSAEAIGHYASELVRDKARPTHDASFYRFTEARVTAGEAWLGVLSSSTRSGGTHLNEVTVSPFALEDATFRGNFVVRRDVAHRAERDAALLQAHTEFRGVLAAIPDGVVVLRDGLVYYANAAFLKLANRDDASLVGLPLTDVLVSEDRDSFERRDTTAPMVVRVRSPTDTRLAEISAAGSISFEGRPATILIARDITERRLSEEQMADAERLSALGELAAGVAHELNNPMAYVLTNLEFLSARVERGGDSALREPLNDALDGVRRMREIATELRTFARGDRADVPEAVDVRRAVASALSIAQNQLRHRAETRRELEPGLWVTAREGQLVQVLVNLLVNAAQGIREGDAVNHSITVRARARAPDQVEISVSDTGPGFPPEILAHLFRPFTTTKAVRHGSGLGLAISRRIVERFGGTIAAGNLDPCGAIVTLTLPSAPPPLPSVGPAPPHVPHGDRSIHLLIVDDEPAIGRALRRVLAYDNVTVAANGPEAIALLTARDFDVILCDLMMPGMSGPRVFELVCERRPELASRFIFISGGVLTEEASRFLESTDRPILAKPFSNAAAIEAVERVMSAQASPKPP